MHRIALSHTAAAIAATIIAMTTGCSTDGSARLRAPSGPGLTEMETDTVSIPVNIYPLWSGSGNTYTYSATALDSSEVVSYTWLVANCPGNVADYDCSEPQYRSSSRSFTITFPQFNSGTKSTIVVEVKQQVPGGRSGANKQYHTTPAPNHGSFYGTALCNLGPDNWLWQSEVYDPATSTYKPDSVIVPDTAMNAGAKVPRVYRRNPCNAVREFNYPKTR